MTCSKAATARNNNEEFWKSVGCNVWESSHACSVSAQGGADMDVRKRTARATLYLEHLLRHAAEVQRPYLTGRGDPV